MSSDLYDQIVDDRGSFKRLLTKIPGFGGYLDRADRRTADRMIRDHVADLLKQRLNRLAQIEKVLLDNGGFSYMSKTSSAKTKLQTYHDRVKTAAPGYSGFFAAVKIEAEELERLYAFDEMQLIYADRFANVLDALETAARNKEGIEDAIADLDALTIEANDAFGAREDSLLKLKTS